MRVIAGTARGVPLRSAEGLATRPVLDRIKQSVFSMLDARDAVRGARVLDLYAGAGSLGIEALSRGAAGCVFIDSSPACEGLIRANLEKAGLSDRAQALRGDCAALAERLRAEGRTFGLVFVDPPFEASRDLGSGGPPADRSLARSLEAAGSMLEEGGLLLLRVEHKAGREMPKEMPGLRVGEVRRWGRNEVAFYSHPATEGANG